MKIKGRRQSSNVVDIRDPVEAAKHSAKMDIRDMNHFGEAEIIAADDAWLGEKIVDQVRGRDAAGMEMLMGPRWKD